jgi:glutamate racemase
MSAAVRPIASQPAPSARRQARILVFDSGLGGLTVFAQIKTLLPAADYLYAADDAGFPYGALPEAALVARVLDVMQGLIGRHRPDVVVIACNTASTLVLPPLRARWPNMPFVGTVPAIKPAALASHSRMISVLATPGTARREYTQDLVRIFAGDCAVTLVGAAALAGLCEDVLRNGRVVEAAVAAEIAPAFVSDGARRTDVVVLACTHYPLLSETLRRVAPWPVTYIDSAAAIARRVAHVLSEAGFAQVPGSGQELPGTAMFTSAGEPGSVLRAALAVRGLQTVLTQRCSDGGSA